MATGNPFLHSGARPASPARDASPRDGAMMAHDVRSALQAVTGGVALLDRSGLAPALVEQVDRIEAASKSLARLVSRMLGGGPAAAAPVDLGRFLRHLDRLWTGTARERGVAFDIVAAADAPRVVQADFVALERSVCNLVCNALRHAGARRVTVAASPAPGGGLALAVRDDGAGFANPAAQGEGEGLGLRIVRGLCDEMGAGLAIGARPEGGVEARLVFPGHLCAAGRDGPEAEPAATGTELRGVRVLFAEDNPTNQIVGMQMLRALGAEPVLAVDGVDALQKFDAAVFDLVLADIEMPRLSGLDLIRAIRGRGDARARAPIVALTAYAMHEHRERIAEAGANGLISKPVTSVEAFGRALRAHVGAPAGGGAPAAGAVVGGGTVAAAGPEVDLQIFEALCAAMGMEMMGELLDKVEADLTQARADLVGASGPVDLAAIRSATHILISVAGIVGATGLQASARRLNRQAREADGGEGGPQGADAVVREDIVAELRRCIGEIDGAVAFARRRRPAD